MNHFYPNVCNRIRAGGSASATAAERDKTRIGEGRKTTGIISYSVAGDRPVSAVRIIRELGKTLQSRKVGK